MQYEDLENNLKTNICPAYTINGGESFLTTSALRTIEKSLNLSFPDLNKTIFQDSFSGSARQITVCCENLPLFDKKKLVIVHDYVQRKNEGELKTFVKYLENPNPSTVLVFFSTNKSDFFSSLETYTKKVSCEKVSNRYLFDFVYTKLNALSLKADREIVAKLLDFCNYSITKVDTEIDKLSSVKMFDKDKTITDKDIETYISKDTEYMLFDLSNAITRKDKDSAYLIADAMIKNKEQPTLIISLIANHFRKMFFVSKSVLSTNELARLLNVKEYAIGKYRERALTFSQRRLKRIFDECINVEFLVKSGKMTAENAVTYLISKILDY